MDLINDKGNFICMVKKTKNNWVSTKKKKAKIEKKAN